MGDMPYGWCETYTGVRFQPLNPVATDIRIEDIAHALAHQCRYAGHTRFHYSVAQHCVLLADWVRFSAEPGIDVWSDWHGVNPSLVMLMHDAAEAYLTDLPRPVKHSMPEYLVAERRLEDLIFYIFGLPRQLPDWAKTLDSRIIADEHPQLMSGVNRWKADSLQPLGVKIRRWSPRRAKWEFLRRFYQWHVYQWYGGMGPLRAAWTAWRHR